MYYTVSTAYIGTFEPTPSSAYPPIHIRTKRCLDGIGGAMCKREGGGVSGQEEGYT